MAAGLRTGWRRCLTCNRARAALHHRTRFRGLDSALYRILYKTIDLSAATPDTAADLAREFVDAYVLMNKGVIHHDHTPLV